MPLTLTLTDNQDSSGATATIAGSSGGANVVYVIAADMLFTALWIASGSLVGDGDVTLSLVPGYYWAYVASNGSTLSSIVYFPVSRANDSTYNRIKQAIKAKIQSLDFPALTTPPGALPASQVYEMAYPNLNAINVPAVVITEWSLKGPIKEVVHHYGSSRGGIAAGTNLRDDIAYPVVVSIIDRCDPTFTAPLPTYRLWRERIFRALRYQRLAGLPEVYTVVPLPGSMADWPKADAYHYFVSELEFEAVSRESRGI